MPKTVMDINCKPECKHCGGKGSVIVGGQIRTCPEFQKLLDEWNKRSK